MNRKDVALWLFAICILGLICVVGDRLNQHEAQQAHPVDQYIADLQEQIDIIRKDLNDLKNTKQTVIIEDEPLGTLWDGATGLLEASATVSTAKTMEYVGVFNTSAYCACRRCCGKTDGITASGAKVQEGLTIAADLSVFPFGTVLYLDNIGYRTVQDTGNFKGNKLDLYFSSHSEALIFGRQNIKVWIVK